MNESGLQQPGPRALPILMVGLNHRAAPVEVRERVAFGPERLPEALRELTGGGESGGGEIRGAVLLSTCNRTEIYTCLTGAELSLQADPPAGEGAEGTSPAGGARERFAAVETRLLAFLARQAGLSGEELRRMTCILRGSEAVHHLMEVAAGLDSLVFGENEILGQVRAASEAARSAGADGPLLAALFRYAVHAGKRARSETEIGLAKVSIANLVVELAEQSFGSLKDRTALLVGAGKISAITARALVGAGLRCVMVANRTYERAQRLAQSLNGTAVHFDALDEVLPGADIVICSTGAPHTVLHAATVAKAQLASAGRPLVIADLAVPRDVDPQVVSIPGVRLTNIDDLGTLAKTGHPGTASACRAVEEILLQEEEDFYSWYDARRSAGVLQALFQKAETICAAEVEQTLQRLGPLTPHQTRLVRALGKSIAGKLLHEPAVCLRELPPDQDPSAFIEVVQDLYNLR